jgi:SulP family sulfate permease
LLRLFRSIRPLKPANALRDALAGVVLAAMNIPQALGYTRIAGMPVITGLYTLLLPLVAFAAFGSSRYLVVAADSATAAILAGGVSGMAPSASERYIALAGLVALLTAAFLLIGRLLKLGFVADFLSQTVLIGFLTGVGLQVGIAVLPESLGIETHSRRTVLQLLEVLRNLPHVHLPALAVSATVLVFVLVLRRFAPKLPGPLIAVVCAIAASERWNFAAHGISTIGPVVGGLPHLRLPDVGWRDCVSLLGVSVSCAVMIVTQSAATARVYAGRHHQRLDENDDLVGLAAANAAAAISGTFVVNGSPTQTAMVESAGAQSQLAQISTAVVVAFVLLFLTGPLQYLPHCVLGALVLLVAIRLIDLHGLREISEESPAEYMLALTTASVVVLVGVEQGIVLAMVMSLLRIVHHSYHPHSGVMVRDENGNWIVIPAAPGAVTKPGLVLYRFGAALFYANAGRFADEISCIVGPTPSPVRWIIIDAEAITHVDYTAARVLRELKQDLATAGVELAFARVPWECRADLNRHHLTEVIGTHRFYNHLHTAIAAFSALE